MNTSIKNNSNALPYQIFEDDGGTLYMYVWTNAKRETLAFASPVLPCDIAACIEDVANAETWDEDLDSLACALGEDDITSADQLPAAREAHYYHLTDYDYGVTLVADNEGIYPEHMGCAAREAFGIGS